MIRVLDCKSFSGDDVRTTATVLRHLLGGVSPSALNPHEKLHLENVHWTTRTFEKGSALISQSESRNMISVVLSGWAFRFQNLPDGKRQIFDFVFAGATVGFGAGDMNYYGVEAATKCIVATLPKAQFRRLLMGCPTLAVHVAEQVAESEMRAYEHMTSLGRRSARERVAALIVELMSRTRFANSTMSEDTLELPVSQIMIGDALGLSNEHVCRTLGKLVNAGIIELGRHALRVLNPLAVAQEAGLDFDHIPCTMIPEVRAA
jgi:CRP/FNR family transcriptional regulator, anaerobic regulatory protein